MRHVDEGTIHAWLDGEIADPGEAAWIEEHLHWCAACGARVADERATREQAHALLAIASPTAEPPAFQELAARAEKETRSGSERTAADSLQRSRWLLQVGWAASIVLAATIGWTAREFAESDSVTSVVLAPTLEEIPASEPNPSVNTPGTTSTPPPPPAAGGQSAMAVGPEAARSGAIQQQLVDRLREERSRIAAAPAGERGVSFAPEPQLPAAVAPEASARGMLERSGGAAPGFPARSALSGLEAPPLQAPSAPAAVVPPPPAALGQTAAVTVAPAPQAAVEARRALPAPALETVTVTGASPAADAANVASADWQMVPRTEAAVRSGMALYGIDGLEPQYTAISLDRRTVRTVYRLENGVAVDLEQQRPLPNGAATITSLQPAAARGPSPATRIVVPPDAGSARVWSELRGGFRVLLRTTSEATDLSALGAKLRVQ
jgi:hypothetical protein